jgi:hypothetical protein
MQCMYKQVSEMAFSLCLARGCEKEDSHELLDLWPLVLFMSSLLFVNVSCLPEAVLCLTVLFLLLF